MTVGIYGRGDGGGEGEFRGQRGWLRISLTAVSLHINNGHGVFTTIAGHAIAILMATTRPQRQEQQ